MRGVDFTYVIGPRNGKPKPGNLRSIDPSYFDIMRIPVKAGRVFTAADNASAAPVIVVSESYGRQHFLAMRTQSERRSTSTARTSRSSASSAMRAIRKSRRMRRRRSTCRGPRIPFELICLIVRPQPGDA